MTRAMRVVTLAEKTQLTPNMVRVVLTGESLNNFPEGMEGGYVKLLLPKEGPPGFPPSLELASVEALQAEQGLYARSYTIRDFDESRLRLTLDFALHPSHASSDGLDGPAARWIKDVRPGDTAVTNGPGAVKMLDAAADWFFIAGDMTALPAISANLEKLPADAAGYAVIEIQDVEDQQVLNAPEGMAIHWVLNPHPQRASSLLADEVKALPWREGRASVWVAGEFDAMRSIRRYFRQERGVERELMYASSYWKIGETDEGNKAAKKLDTEA